MASAYEKMRDANIRRNAAMLESLGLNVNEFSTQLSAPVRKRKRQKRRPAAQPTRKSLRVMGVAARVDARGQKIIDAEGSGELDIGDEVDRSVEARGQRLARAVRRIREQKPPARDSIRRVNVDIKSLDSEWLGRACGRLKREVVQLCCGSPSRHVKFSKYSGIAEWKNAIVLFVNIFGDGYKNIFLRGGRQITWFAQARQSEETPVIQQMLPPESLEDQPREVAEEAKVAIKRLPVLLFCREYQKPYVYCGRLEYLGHDPTRAPLRFVWNLRDADKLLGRGRGNGVSLSSKRDGKGDDDEEIGELFESLVQASQELVKSQYGPASVPDSPTAKKKRGKKR